MRVKGEYLMAGKKMAKKKEDSFRKQLLAIKENTLHDIKNLDSVNSPDSKDTNGGDVSGHAQHMADVATDMYDREFNLGLASNDRELLNKVETALRRLEDHTYGSCTVCKKPIKEVRLKAIPYAETCLKCQEEIEEKTP